MRALRPLTDGELERAYNTLYKEAFPPSELKPLRAMTQTADGGRHLTLGWFDGGALLGCASLWSADGGYLLLDYLVVPKEQRGGGIGRALLGALLDDYPDGTVFMIESEAPTGDPARDGLILRRLDFYRRCGARPIGFDAAVFGVRYKLLALSRGEADAKKFLSRYTALYRGHFPDGLWERAFRIPLRDGDAIPVFDEWIEEEQAP